MAVNTVIRQQSMGQRSRVIFVLATLISTVVLVGLLSRMYGGIVQAAPSGGIKVASYNILTDTKERAGQSNEHILASDLWEARKARIVQEIDAQGYGIIGFQELGSGSSGVAPTMPDDIRALLPARFQTTTASDFGTYNTRGSNMVAWDNTRFAYIDGDDYLINARGYRTLTDDPCVVTDSDCYWKSERWLQWILFEDRVTGRQFYHLNTHLDHTRSEFRAHQLEKILAFSATLDQTLPVILTGDMNDTDMPSEALYPMYRAAGFLNTRTEAITKINSEYASWIGYRNDGGVRRLAEPKVGTSNLDHIFIKNPSANPLTVTEYETRLVNHSDHAPVTATLHYQFAATPVPTIVGSLRVGETLRVDAGSWSPSVTSLSYQWFRNGTAIAGAIGSSYLLGADDEGAQMTVTVTAYRLGYTTISTSSAQTVAILESKPVAVDENKPATRGVGAPNTGLLSIDTHGVRPILLGVLAIASAAILAHLGFYKKRA